MAEEASQSRQSIMTAEQADKLSALFGKLPQPVAIHYFTDAKKPSPFDRIGQDVLAAISRLSAKITLHTHDIEHELAKKWGVARAPAMVFSPERYNFHWYGVPAGEEGRTLIEALFLLGTGQSGLSAEAEKVARRLEGKRQVKIFVSPSCPYCPQEAVNGIRAVVAAPDKVSLAIIDIQVNPELAAAYKASSVPQAFANDLQIGLGAQSEELFMASLEKLEQQNIFIPSNDAERIDTDVVIVGGGPAGLTAGIYAARSGLRAVVVERGSLGGQVATTPVVENYPSLPQIGGKTLVDMMVTHALEYVQIFPGEEVVDVHPGEVMEVVTSRRRFMARALLLATGARHRHLGVDGEKRLAGRGVSYCSTCDGPFFKGKKVVIVGGGNSALTEALHLKNVGVEVTVVHRRDTFRAEKRLVESLGQEKIPVLFNTEVREIRGEQQVEEVVLFNSGENTTSTMAVAGVFVSIGYEPTVDLARKLGVELGPEGYIKTDNLHRTSVPGIYAAGDVEGGFKQIVTAAGHGSAAALAIFEDIINPYWKRQGESRQGG